MKAAIALLALLGITAVSAQGSYGGFKYQANLAPVSANDIPGTSGTVLVRTQGDTLFFQASLNAQQVTFLDIHLSPGNGATDGGPLILRIADISASPQSATPGNPVALQGTKTTSDLLASPMLTQARAALQSQGITDNSLQNIGDVDRLLARGAAYSDVHSVVRAPPLRVESGLYFTIGGSGRRLRNLH